MTMVAKKLATEIDSLVKIMADYVKIVKYFGKKKKSIEKQNNISYSLRGESGDNI